MIVWTIAEWAIDIIESNSLIAFFLEGVLYSILVHTRNLIVYRVGCTCWQDNVCHQWHWITYNDKLLGVLVGKSLYLVCHIIVLGEDIGTFLSWLNRFELNLLAILSILDHGKSLVYITFYSVKEAWVLLHLPYPVVCHFHWRGRQLGWNTKFLCFDRWCNLYYKTILFLGIFWRLSCIFH